jgi:hypothetical protein
MTSSVQPDKSHLFAKVCQITKLRWKIYTIIPKIKPQRKEQQPLVLEPGIYHAGFIPLSLIHPSQVIMIQLGQLYLPSSRTDRQP